MMSAAVLTNLPALLVVIPLLLAPFSALLPIAACFDSDSDCCRGSDNSAWFGLDPAD